MQKNTTRKSILSGIRLKGSRLQTQNIITASPLSKLFRSIDKLHLDKFIEIITFNESQDPDRNPLELLIIEGTATPAELEDAWSGIFLEYIDASRNAKARLKITLAKDVKLFAASLSIIETCVFALQVQYHQKITPHPDIVAELRKRGNDDLDFNPEDRAGFFRDLNMAFSRSREIKIDMELAQIELDEQENSDKLEETEGKADKNAFLNILARLARFHHCGIIRASEITVAEYCATLNDYLDDIKAQNKAAANRKNSF